MNKAQKIACILFLSVFFLVSYSSALTIGEDNFNPNYIISDEEMQEYNSLTREEIQAFLDDFDGYIADWRTADKDGIERKTADIIYRAAQEYKINPKYLLVKLQKEMSLITVKNPTQRQLDFATGYGCPDSGGCDSKNKGFGKQVDAAAGIIRWYYDNYFTEVWIKRPNRSYIIDGEIVIPKNFATAFLYTYTPHLHGNKNFWKLWNEWFGQVYPDGSLVKTSNNPAVYLLQDGTKRLIKSMGVLASRFDPKMVITIPASELANYADGKELNFPNYSILRQGSNYYLIDFDTIRPFASEEVVRSLGYNPEEIIDVSPSDLLGYNMGTVITTDLETAPIGRLVKTKETNSLYYLKDNFYYPLTDSQIAKINFPNLQIEMVSITELQNYTTGEILKFQDGTLMGIKGNNKIYVIEKGKKRHIASEEVFNGFGFNWKNIIWTDQITGMNHPFGQPLYLPSRLNTSLDEKQTSTPPTTQVDNGGVGDTEKMIRATTTIFVGDKKFETNLDTYLVADYKTGEILAGKNIDFVRPLASFTKIMSAYEFLHAGLQLNHSHTYAGSLDKSAYHNFRVAEGEKIKNQNLLEAMLVSSINTAAKMLANELGGEKLMVKKMNEKIKSWGLEKTKFTDTYGYDLKNVGTAREFLFIFTKAVTNDTLQKTLGLKSYEYLEIKDLDGKPKHFDNNSNDLANKSNLSFNIIASKTGYLDEAGAGLAMLIERPLDGKKFIIITMGNAEYNRRFDEPEKLTNWVINNF